MKNLHKVGLLAIVLVIIPSLVLAAEFKHGDQPSLLVGENVNGDLYMAGGNTTSSGSVFGDLFVAGGSVLVNGTVSGDLFAGGGNVTIISDISDDLRVVGGNITVSGDVRGDVLAGGGQINLVGRLISGDVVIAGGAVRIDSRIRGDVKIGGGEIYINSPISGDVNVKVDKLTLGPKAEIRGDLTYSAQDVVTLEEGAVVLGETIYKEITKDDKGGAKSNLHKILTFLFIAKFLMFLLGALLVGLIFRRYSQELVFVAVSNPLKEFGRGVITFIVLPILSLFLLVTIIGIPLGILGLLSFAVLTTFTAILTPIVLGAVTYKWIFKKMTYEVNWKSIVLGLVIFFILGLIPFIGWLIVLISMAITLGAAIKIKWGIAKTWR